MTAKFEIERYHEVLDPHKPGSNLRDVILGGQDGLVNVLGVILGIAAASGDTRLIIAAGLAATFAESVSMGAVAYTSTLAEHDYYLSEAAREMRHIQRVPEHERREIRDIYKEKGFEGDLLERVVQTITANPKVWVDVMMAEELRLSPVEKREALRVAIIVGLSALVGSLIPLAPFFVLSVGLGILASLAISGLALFIVGAYKAQITVGRWHRSGVQMALIGLVSALVGFAVGYVFRVLGGT